MDYVWSCCITVLLYAHGKYISTFELTELVFPDNAGGRSIERPLHIRGTDVQPNPAILFPIFRPETDFQ